MGSYFFYSGTVATPYQSLDHSSIDKHLRITSIANTVGRDLLAIQSMIEKLEEDSKATIGNVEDIQQRLKSVMGSSPRSVDLEMRLYGLKHLLTLQTYLEADRTLGEIRQVKQSFQWIPSSHRKKELVKLVEAKEKELLQLNHDEHSIQHLAIDELLIKLERMSPEIAKDFGLPASRLMIQRALSELPRDTGLKELINELIEQTNEIQTQLLNFENIRTIKDWIKLLTNLPIVNYEEQSDEIKRFIAGQILAMDKIPNEIPALTRLVNKLLLSARKAISSKEELEDKTKSLSFISIKNKDVRLACENLHFISNTIQL